MRSWFRARLSGRGPPGTTGRVSLRITWFPARWGCAVGAVQADAGTDRVAAPADRGLAVPGLAAAWGPGVGPVAVSATGLARAGRDALRCSSGLLLDRRLSVQTVGYPESRRLTPPP